MGKPRDIWRELQDNATRETGFEERHEARRYRQIDPYVNQMGGWANFSSWMATHARSYFNSWKESDDNLNKANARIAELEKQLEHENERHNECRSSWNEVQAKLESARGVIVPWIDFEDRSIAKEGPYVGMEINSLISKAKKWLEENK